MGVKHEFIVLLGWTVQDGLNLSTPTKRGLSMKAPQLLTALTVLCPALAWSAPTHNVMSNQGLYVSEPGAASQNISSADMTFVWTEGTTNAFGLAKAWVATGDAYEFQLASVTAPTTATSIQGLWNISKNGTLLCAS